VLRMVDKSPVGCGLDDAVGSLRSRMSCSSAAVFPAMFLAVEASINGALGVAVTMLVMVSKLLVTTAVSDSKLVVK